MEKNVTKFLFWNIHKRYDNVERAIRFGIDESIDIIALIEAPIETKDKIATAGFPYRVLEHFDIDLRRGIEVLVSPTIDVKESNFCREEKRFCILRNDIIDINLAVVHLNSGMSVNADDIRQTDISQLNDALNRIEGLKDSKNTMVIGDFNINVMDKQMLDFSGLNARLFAYQTQKGVKTIHDAEKDIFYNPMLSVYRDTDDPEKARATYYYEGSHLQWLCYDQVLLKQSLMTRFSRESLQVIDLMNGEHLVKDNKIDIGISDHLPVYFELNNVEA